MTSRADCIFLKKFAGLFSPKLLLQKFKIRESFFIAVEENPIEALSRIGEIKLKNKPISKLKKEARAEVEKMPSRKYADSDFFLALMKDSDWLKN